LRKKPNNPRTISKTEYARLQADLEEYGDLGGIVHNETTGNLVGGNQRASVFDLLGKGAEIIIAEEHAEPTRTGETARGYVLWHGEKYDYRRVAWDAGKEDAACLVANLRGGTWDWDMLPAFDDDLLRNVGFDADLLKVWNDDGANLALMLRAAEEGPPEDEPVNIDRAEELQEKWGVKTGDVWEIPSKTAAGIHLLLCGDSRADNAQLGALPGNWVYDPPWDLELSKPIGFESILVFGDGGSAKRVIEMFGAPEWIFTWDCQGNFFTNWKRPMRRAKYVFWYGDIDTFDLKGAFFGEPEAPMIKTSNFGNEKYLSHPDPRGKHMYDLFVESLTKLHSTMGHEHEKTLDWIRLLVGDCFRGDVYDPFTGSGTTFVACEQLGRRCVGAEIEPRFVALTLQRLSDMGLTPKLASA